MNKHAASMHARTEPSDRAAVKVGVGVIVTDDSGRVLLERRSDSGLWGLPGGAVEPGETVAETGLREVREETGFTVEILHLLGVYSDPRERIVVYPDNGDERHLVDAILVGRIVSGKAAVSAESLDLRFYAPGDLPGDEDISPPSRKPLADWRRGLANVIA